MADQSSDPGFLRRPPLIPPLVAFLIGIVCVPLGASIQGAVGGGLVGGGIVLILGAIWDTLRIVLGVVQYPEKDSKDA